MSLQSAAMRTVGPLIPRPVRSALQKRRFFSARDWRNLHWGVFDSFESANEFVRLHGEAPRFEMDQHKWLTDKQVLLPHDYPPLFWLTRIFQSPVGQNFTRVLDLGGSVGVTFLAFKPYLQLPPNLRWEVCELPDTAEFGRQVARDRGETQLSFTTDSKAVDGADILFTAGTIQYIDTPLHQTLGGLANAPKHVLINRLPLTPNASFVTLQNSGIAVWPYHILNDTQFVQAMKGIGYRVVDRWKCLQNSTSIPFHPEHTLDHFHGFYFAHESVA
ncbi:methyltransferase, TIGR04325 family [Variovorax sp. J22R133]|uniref:methyltransferase, TIGR04325 family n=1 Tax=Variovorax brevis TaxID=3053503 RepID=UPI00257805EC|nr:methyltransferase, TIGR04325 family [Variovorax sp. J22R133]MDM0111701.1 methyltransferase, TIGR04325 family [Variovorax sp. J22R133]